MKPYQLQSIYPVMGQRVAELFAEPMNAAARWGHIDTPARFAAFIGQVLHESRGFARMIENLDYRVDALTNYWPKRFAGGLAEMYGRIDGKQKSNPTMIANVAYANRLVRARDNRRVVYRE